MARWRAGAEDVYTDDCMEWLNYALTYALGFFSHWFWGSRSDRKQTERALGARVYQPLHEQLSRMHSRVGERLRLDEEPVWRQLQASGLTEKVPRRVRVRIVQLYEKVLPTYTSAWESAFQQWTLIGQRWDSQYGVQFPPSYSMLQFNWWTFLIADECDESVIPRTLGTNEVVHIWSGVMTANRLTDLHTTVSQFFRDRWSEARDDPAFVHFRAVRRRTLDEIEKAMKRLARHIKP